MIKFFHTILLALMCFTMHGMESDQKKKLNNPASLKLLTALKVVHQPSQNFLSRIPKDLHDYLGFIDAHKEKLIKKWDASYLLFEAARSGHASLIFELLTRGADIYTTQGRYRKTPLMAAAGNGHQECVRALLQLGVPVSQSDLLEKTALICTFGMGIFQKKCFDLLLEAEIAKIPGANKQLDHYKNNANYNELMKEMKEWRINEIH